MTNSHLRDTLVSAMAFDKAIDFLGEPSTSLLIEKLIRRGVYFNDPDFDMRRLSNAVGDIVGVSTASLIFERFAIELDKLERQR